MNNEEQPVDELTLGMIETHPWRVLDEMISDRTDLYIIVQWLKQLPPDRLNSAIRHSALFHTLFSTTWNFAGFTSSFLVGKCICRMQKDAGYFAATMGLYYNWWADFNDRTMVNDLRRIVSENAGLKAVNVRFHGSEYSDFKKIMDNGIDWFVWNSGTMGHYLRTSRLSWMFLEYEFVSTLFLNNYDLACKLISTAVGGPTSARNPDEHEYCRMAVYNLLRACLIKGDISTFQKVVETIWRENGSVSAMEIGSLVVREMLVDSTFRRSVESGQSKVFSDIVFEMNMNPIDIEELDVFIQCYLGLRNIPAPGSEDAQLMDFFNLDFDWTTLPGIGE